MKHVKLKSENIYSAGYDVEKRTLEIRFVRNMILYEYDYVPEFLYRGLVSSPSPGKYFDENIRGTYNYRIVDEKKKE